MVDVDGVGHKSTGYTALVQAAQQGFVEVVRFLVEEGKADVDKVDHRGATPLMMACINGREAVVRLLLEKGADKSIETTNPPGHTALSVAGRHSGVVALLEAAT